MAQATDLPRELWARIFTIAYYHQLYDYLCHGQVHFWKRPFELTAEPCTTWTLPQLAICRHLYAVAKDIYLSKASLHVEGTRSAREETLRQAQARLAQHPQGPLKIRHLDLAFERCFESSELDTIIRACPVLFSCRIAPGNYFPVIDLARQLPQCLQRLSLNLAVLTFEALQVILDLPCLTRLYLFDILTDPSSVFSSTAGPPAHLTTFWCDFVPFEVVRGVLERSPRLTCFEWSNSPFNDLGLTSSIPGSVNTLRFSQDVHGFGESHLASLQDALTVLSALPSPLSVDLHLHLELIDSHDSGLLEETIAALSTFPHQLETLRLQLSLARPVRLRTSSQLLQLLSRSLQQVFVSRPPTLPGFPSAERFRHLKTLDLVINDEDGLGPIWSEPLEKFMVQERHLHKVDGSLWCRQDFTDQQV